MTWSDARLTDLGREQARLAHDTWRKQIEDNDHKIPFPESFYVSPLKRCLETASVTFEDLDMPAVKPFRPVVKEVVDRTPRRNLFVRTDWMMYCLQLLRETLGMHTCDRRSTKSSIQAEFPLYRFEDGFAEPDPLWDPTLRESDSARNARLQRFLDDVFTADPAVFVSLTAHSGAITSILDVAGHRPFALATGAAIPVLVRAECVEGEPEMPVDSPVKAPAAAAAAADPTGGGFGSGSIDDPRVVGIAARG